VNPVSGYTSQVQHGGKFMFEVALMEGYTQSKITVRSNNIVINAIGGVYTINNIVTDQAITVSGLELNKYRVIAKANAGGTITPSGTMTLTHGESQWFEMMTNVNYKIDKVLVNEQPVSIEGSSYLLENITADVKIDVYFIYNVGISEKDDALITVFSHNKVVTIVNENLIPVQSVEIMDMYGRVVWAGQTTGEKNEIILNVATGIYSVRVILNDNQKITAKISIY
jgi:hypothetical protein